MVAFYFFSVAREYQNFPKELGGAGISLPNFWQENIILKIYYKDTFLSFKDFIYLFERQSTSGAGETQREKDKQTPC